MLTAFAAILALTVTATVYSSAHARSSVSHKVSAMASATPSAAPTATPSMAGTTSTAAPSSTPAEAPTAAPAVAAPAAAAPAVPAAPATGVTPALDAEINGIIDANSQYQVGVTLIDLSDGSSHQYGVQAPFEAASTAKVLAAAAYYHLVETGAVSLDDPLGEYTAGFQIKEMIQDSDNDSWSLVMDAVGYSELQSYAASIGVSYDPMNNTLTPSEMASIMAGLYGRKLLDQQDTAQLLSYMRNTNYESLIPAAVPAGVTVFHKYGLLDDELHDASILTNGTNSYAFVVYTKGQDESDIPARTDLFHQLTQAVVNGLF
ncbi:serine hydrolase [Arthrobacter sp. FW306-2-2C-D06B]|uniref:serine hydrolase n=1 Tax=Arthrobacter sp. FW306-2-2C-D06B TaxID=2879618 RepID=UPI001F2D1646|nr:serine hydrolase [Arthrobacter sp. FW306-2-2C-D06B]UKA58289.1 class A beta-lactamase-related serine hydrolase [Arthrobacter sp. FW306-2-2C-D06B]